VKRAVLILLALTTTLPVQAAVFTVTKTADTLDGACDHDCSLREAVSAANSTEATDVVVVPAGIYVLTRAGAGEDSNASGDLDVTAPLILVGAGAGSTALDGAGLDRVLDVQARAEVFGVTVRNGRVNGNGGGILVRTVGLTPGDLLLRRSVVSGNLAQNGGDGGGIASHSRLEVRESAILENRAKGDGGGIAGIFSLRSSTVSGNAADGSGGGLSFPADQEVTISGSTVAFNRAQVSGGGVYAQRSLFPADVLSRIQGSIVAQNLAAEDPDCHRALSAGYNLIGIRGSCALEPTDRSGTAAAGLSVNISDLTGAFSPTPVHILLDFSPAAGFVPASLCEPADQAGQARSAPCEAGAWEKAEHPVCIPGGSVLCLQNGRFQVSASWTDEGLARDAQAVPLTDDTGNYWFFSPDNLELMVKILDGCTINQRWWVFTSGLTDRGVGLFVQDLATGLTLGYNTPQGTTYPPILDTSAFGCAPAAPAANTATASGEPTDPPAVLAVTKTEDTLDGVCDHDCSLREAVTAANLREGMGVIVLGPGVYTLTREGRGEDQSATGDLDVTDGLLVLGAGAERTVLDGGGIDRVLDVGPSLDLHDVTVRNGRATGPSFFNRTGGGILAFGRLSLVRSLVTANRAELSGGGIYAQHELRVRDSTVSGNQAEEEGGGIYGGFDLDLENVTVSGNQAGERGGGIYLDLDLSVLTHVTITGNSAPEAGGVFVGPLDCQILCPQISLHLDWTVIAGNTAGITPDCGGSPFYVGSRNVVGVREGCGLTIGADREGTLANPLDPRLSALGFHGGPTPTHAPLPGSPVLDLASCPAGRDQRGRPRPDQTLCDAGSVERLPGCQPDEDTLCLGARDRFEVTVRWATKTDDGSGKAVPLALDTGAFWFFQADNLELTVKVLDGCGTNDRYWVFLSGLTDVGVEVTVRDTKTGKTWTHTHAAGKPFQPRLDTSALDVCP